MGVHSMKQAVRPEEGASASPPPASPPAQRFTEFDAKLDIEYDAKASRALNKDYWRVRTPFKYYLDDDARLKWVHVPQDYLTDGASSPRLLWSLVPPWGAYGQAAVLHDYLCENLSIESSGRQVSIKRAEADSIFKHAMKVLGVPRWKRDLMYIAVRVYGKWTAITGSRSRAARAKAAYLASQEVPTASA